MKQPRQSRRKSSRNLTDPSFNYNVRSNFARKAISKQDMTREKDRKISYVLDILKKWKDLRIKEKILAQEAANKLNFSKKTLDDYQTQFKICCKLNFNFRNAVEKNLRMSYVRDFVRRKKLRQHISKEQKRAEMQKLYIFLDEFQKENSENMGKFQVKCEEKQHEQQQQEQFMVKQEQESTPQQSHLTASQYCQNQSNYINYNQEDVNDHNNININNAWDQNQNQQYNALQPLEVKFIQPMRQYNEKTSGLNFSSQQILIQEDYSSTQISPSFQSQSEYNCNYQYFGKFQYIIYKLSSYYYIHKSLFNNLDLQSGQNQTYIQDQIQQQQCQEQLNSSLNNNFGIQQQQEEEQQISNDSRPFSFQDLCDIFLKGENQLSL